MIEINNCGFAEFTQRSVSLLLSLCAAILAHSLFNIVLRLLVPKNKNTKKARERERETDPLFKML